ncbi:MAG TPA: hypothetical protein VKB38_02210 [Terracidiphilus sp.]|nr:hypothetical protein [Terracidiphilus sp.]
MTGEGPDCLEVLKGAAAYSAQRTRDTVQIKLAGMPGGESVTEVWSLSERGNLLTVSLPDRKIAYRKASWFRSVFYSNDL